jgi:GNAT superfamily N-acetyltransferase
MSYDIRPMSRSDLDMALGWARDEGWNPGLDDAEPFYTQDPRGFLMGWLDDEPIGCISVVKYGRDFSFLGLYIVRPQYRGKGYGKGIWDAGIASASDRTIGLDGVVAQQDNYRKSGFVLAHRSARWSGVIDRAGVGDPKVRSVVSADLPSIEAFDRRCFPASRTPFLSAWLDSGARHSMCYVDNDGVRGFGTIRRSVDGYKIGPLFAESPQVAEPLFYTLAARASSSPVVIDVPATNEGAVEMVRRAGLASSFETARMYRGPAPAQAVGLTFGITTLELG